MVATRSGVDTKADMTDMHSSGKRGRGSQGGLQGGLEARLERGLEGELRLKGYPSRGLEEKGFKGFRPSRPPPTGHPEFGRTLSEKHILGSKS